MTEAEMPEMRREFAEAPSRRVSGGGCPTAEELWASARSSLRGAANEGVVLHIAECAACAAAWRLARDLSDEHGGAQPAVRATSAARSAGPRITLALAASLALVAGGLAVWMQPGPSQPALRAPHDHWLRPAPGLEAIDRQAPLLHWTAGPEGTIYDVRVTTEDLEVLQVGWRLNTAELRLDAAALDRVPDGEPIHWQVTARLPDGRVVDSPTFTTPVR